MTLRDLIPVTDTFRIIMVERNTNTTMVILSNDLIVKSFLLDCKIIDIYANNGINVELKFNKNFYHLNKKLFK